MVIIDNASLSDLEEVYEVERRSFEDPYPLALLKAYLFISGNLFVVARDGKVVGYAVGVMQGRWRGHVISLAVEPEFRGAGLGKSLLGELHRRFGRLGCTYSFLEVGVSNEIALGLYRSLGYYVVGLKVGYYGRGKHAFIMVKDLKGRKGVE
ncbi:ribosomal-protein-alanine N-acetyltransferase RimI [Sulfodiicoccus acidiphilus]|uniref:Ribosomal-protein-alanine N-acetyltransferase RimI n=1 Tax=Sulfodiicoccus acidiphilus TaxID=1670455 RepID=A0A348B715_9CREN|nr:ribosomal protein S18-alanine N-acetyltransferase [Sulfodiicoccus acidiphilus]BBD73967.1 ribosomal-protein-alanine N-acetyltransferase RimI [Sulfodiicoccus acidiphilus]GGU02734.1 ribosomal-protein-alanine N-acetyltransferase RimI [Sulfodiicoccus acidiphilus]